jgi:hypothetical protein
MRLASQPPHRQARPCYRALSVVLREPPLEAPPAHEQTVAPQRWAGQRQRLGSVRERRGQREPTTQALAQWSLPHWRRPLPRRWKRPQLAEGAATVPHRCGARSDYYEACCR